MHEKLAKKIITKKKQHLFLIRMPNSWLESFKAAPRLTVELKLNFKRWSRVKQNSNFFCFFVGKNLIQFWNAKLTSICSKSHTADWWLYFWWDLILRGALLLCPTFRSTYSTLYLLILERKILDTESRFREIAHLHLNIIFNFKSYRFIISTHPTKFWGHGQLLNQYRPRFWHLSISK